MKDFTVKNTDWFGIYVWASTNVTIEDNNVIETFYGIRLDMSSKSRVARNVVENNSFLGILLCDSTNNTLRDNRMANNTENFGVWGISLADFVNDIDETNIVDGKPVCYLVNQYNKQINADAGLVIAVNCTNIIIRNLNVINNDQGIMFAFTNSSRIEANTISQCTSGIDFYNSFNNTIVGNFISKNSQGISLRWSYDNCLFNNTSTSNGNGIYLYSSDRNVIANNEFSYNYGDYGIDFHESSNNLFYHNNIFKNYKNFCSYSSGDNVWDNGYPSGGNYWSDYEGIDANHDGIGDTVYSLIGINRDRYPLVGMFNSFNTSKGYHVEAISNSTIEDFEYSESNSTIMMHVSNMTQTQNYGFCRLTIPHDLLSPPYTITINGTQVSYTPIFENETLSIIYFSYEHSELEIIIIPEFLSLLILPLFMIATLLAVIVYRRKYTVRQI
jgi:parallel beta-helix repeat protein